MWPFRSAPKAPSPRYVEVMQRLDDVELALDGIRDTMRKLNARITNLSRLPPNDETPETEERGRTAPPLVRFPREKSRRGF